MEYERRYLSIKRYIKISRYKKKKKSSNNRIYIYIGTIKCYIYIYI